MSSRDHTVFSPMGQIAKHHLHFVLEEIQKAEVGRKFAFADRRPLDPPPVAKLRLFDVQNAGSQQQFAAEITNYRQNDTFGLVCAVDLFPVPESVWQSSSHGQPVANEYPARTVHSQDVVHYMCGHPINASSIATEAIVGEKVAEPIIADCQGHTAIFFAFKDLAVQREGTFILRYRLFDISSLATPGMGSKVLAEAFGEPFKVYPTKDFPGLGPSTELTILLSKYSHMVVRHNRRPSRKRPHEDSEEAATNRSKEL